MSLAASIKMVFSTLSRHAGIIPFS